MAIDLYRSESKGIRCAMLNATDGKNNGVETENVGSEQKSACSIEYEMEHGSCGRAMKLG
jgi:hypothetical protein